MSAAATCLLCRVEAMAASEAEKRALFFVLGSDAIEPSVNACERHLEPGGGIRREGDLHQRFAFARISNRVRSEWFHPVPELLSFIDQVAAQHPLTKEHP